MRFFGSFSAKAILAVSALLIPFQLGCGEAKPQNVDEDPADEELVVPDIESGDSE